MIEHVAVNVGEWDGRSGSTKSCSHRSDTRVVYEEAGDSPTSPTPQGLDFGDRAPRPDRRRARRRSRAPIATPCDRFHEAALAAGGNRQRRAGHSRSVRRELLRRVRPRPGREQHRGGLPQGSDLESDDALGAADRRAARDPRARPHARARADRAARRGDRRVARVPVGRRRALPRARHLRALLR